MKSALARHPCWSALSALIVVLACGARDASADIISFDTNDWDHGSGPQTGWVNYQTTGTTTFSGITLTVTSTMLGTAVPTADHMGRINQSFFTGFAFQLDPDTTTNGASLLNYARIDFEFSQPVILRDFTLTDVDRTNGAWYDIFAAEGFVNGLGAVGTGIRPFYLFENPTNEEIVDIYGLKAVRPRSNTGNVTNTPPADATFRFDEGVRAFSFYYWNENTTDDGASTQTIGNRGNQFEIIPVPEPGSIAMCILASVLILLAGICRRLRGPDAGFEMAPTAACP